MTINIPVSVKEIINILEHNGFEAYVVGGCVRDSLLGKEPHDWDITTNALPEQMMECFKEYKVIETGLKHGTLTVMINQESFEITTYRVDGIYSDNRHPDTVHFVSGLKEDLSRRDFTINSMAYNSSKGLVDYFNGQIDLQSGTISCVGDADTRFQEDALRIMRAMRFASTYGFCIQVATAQAIRDNELLLNNIAVERISTELNKLICGKGASKILNQFEDVLSIVIPEIKSMIGFQQHNPYHYLDVWEHTIESITQAPESLVLRLSMLFHDIAKPQCYSEDEQHVGHFYGHPQVSSDMAVEILKRLKYDNATIMRVRDLVLYHDADIQPRQKYIRRWLNKIGEETFRQLLEIKKADIKAQVFEYQADRLQLIDDSEIVLSGILEQQQCFSLKDLAVNGHDLMQVGVPEGKDIGIELNRLMNMVIDGDIENDKNKLLNIITSKS